MKKRNKNKKNVAALYITFPKFDINTINTSRRQICYLFNYLSIQLIESESCHFNQALYLMTKLAIIKKMKQIAVDEARPPTIYFIDSSIIGQPDIYF